MQITVEPHSAVLREVCGTETEPGRLAVVVRESLGRAPRVLESTDDYDAAYDAARAWSAELDCRVALASSYGPTVVGEDVAAYVLANPNNQPIELARSI